MCVKMSCSKLNKLKFHGSQTKIESTRGQTIIASSPAKNQPVVVNKNLEKQNLLQNLSFVLGKRNYWKATQPRPSPHNTLIFTDSIPKGIRMTSLTHCYETGKHKY